MNILLVDYPGHLIAIALLLAAGMVLLLAYRPVKQRPAKGWRWLLGIMQLLVIAALLVIIWNPARPSMAQSEAANTVLVFFDSSESMSVTDATGKTRLDRAIEVFDRSFRLPNAQLPNYRIYGFDSNCYNCASSSMLRRWGPQTDMQRLFKVIRRYDTPAGPDDIGTGVVGAVVFTDGQADQKNPELYLPVRNEDFQVLMVGVGSRASSHDVAVESIKVPTTVGIDSLYHIQATVTCSGLQPDEPIRIELLNDGHSMDEKVLTARELTREPQVDFTSGADELGWQRVGVRVSIASQEVNQANNIRQAMVRVARNDDLKVLLYSQVASFDVGKIRSALERDRKIQLDFGLDAIISPARSENVRSMSGHVELPHDKAGFNQYDIVILGPMAYDQLDDTQIDAMYSFVADRGGGLIFLPGKEAPYDLRAIRNKKLRTLLPISFKADDRSVGEAGFAQLTIEGAESGVLHKGDLDDDTPEIAVAYRSLRTKPASTTILHSYDRPILCTHRLGRGRVAVLNAAGLFQWYRANEDGGLLRKLISGLTSYVGRTTTLEAGLELFAQRDADDQTTVTFDAYVYDDNFASVADATVLLEFADQVLRMYPMSIGHYTAEVRNVRDESIVARAEAQVNGVFLGERTCAVTLPLVRGEMDNLPLDVGFLEQLAQKTGGQYIPVNEIDEETVEMFPPTRSISNVSKVQSVWPRWKLLLSLCGLLSAVWFIRRTRGLV